MRWMIFILLASGTVGFADDQLLQQTLKNNALMITKLDVVRFTNYSSRTQLKLNGKTSITRFTNLSSSTQTKLNSKVDKTITVNGQTLSSNVTITTISGNSGTATALAANGTNCSAGQYAQGVDASGNAEGCATPAGTYSLPTATSTILGGVKPDGTSILNSSGSISVANPLNQNTTGSAAKLTTGRTIAGTLFDGSANVALANKFIVQGTADTGLTGALFLGSLGTGIIKNTTSTGALSIAVAGDFPTLNQNTSGTASNITAYTIDQHLGSGSTPIFLTVTANNDLKLGSNAGYGIVVNGNRALALTSTLATFNVPVSVNAGSNVIYYCSGGANSGLLGRGNSGPCSGGTWVATSLKLD